MNSTDNYSGQQVVAMHKAKGAVSKQAKHVSAVRGHLGLYLVSSEGLFY